MPVARHNSEENKYQVSVNEKELCDFKCSCRPCHMLIDTWIKAFLQNSM